MITKFNLWRFSEWRHRQITLAKLAINRWARRIVQRHKNQQLMVELIKRRDQYVLDLAAIDTWPSTALAKLPNIRQATQRLIDSTQAQIEKLVPHA